MSITIPEGTYTIQSQESLPRGVVCPDPASGNPDLFLAAPAPNTIAQQWTIKLDTSTTDSYTVTSTAYYPDKHASFNGGQGAVGAPVISSSIRIPWVFGFPGVKDGMGTYTCSISYLDNNSGVNHYWTCQSISNIIKLAPQPPAYRWTLIPVLPTVAG